MPLKYLARILNLLIVSFLYYVDIVAIYVIVTKFCYCFNLKLFFCSYRKSPEERKQTMQYYREKADKKLEEEIKKKELKKAASS